MKEKHRYVLFIEGGLVGPSVAIFTGEKFNRTFDAFKNCRKSRTGSMTNDGKSVFLLIATDHIHVQHPMDVLEGDGRIFREVFRAYQSYFFSTKANKQHVVGLLLSIAAEMSSQLEQPGNA